MTPLQLVRLVERLKRQARLATSQREKARIRAEVAALMRTAPRA